MEKAEAFPNQLPAVNGLHERSLARGVQDVAVLNELRRQGAILEAILVELKRQTPSPEPAKKRK